MELVGARNVVLWGLSQGCAAALVALLTPEGGASRGGSRDVWVVAAEEAVGGLGGWCGGGYGW
jgi:hypothetical protein